MLRIRLDYSLEKISLRLFSASPVRPCASWIMCEPLPASERNITSHFTEPSPLVLPLHARSSPSDCSAVMCLHVDRRQTKCVSASTTIGDAFRTRIDNFALLRRNFHFAQPEVSRISCTFPKQWQRPVRRKGREILRFLYRFICAAHCFALRSLVAARRCCAVAGRRSLGIMAGPLLTHSSIRCLCAARCPPNNVRHTKRATGVSFIAHHCFGLSFDLRFAHHCVDRLPAILRRILNSYRGKVRAQPGQSRRTPVRTLCIDRRLRSRAGTPFSASHANRFVSLHRLRSEIRAKWRNLAPALPSPQTGYSCNVIFIGIRFGLVTSVLFLCHISPTVNCSLQLFYRFAASLSLYRSHCEDEPRALRAENPRNMKKGRTWMGPLRLEDVVLR